MSGKDGYKLRPEGASRRNIFYLILDQGNLIFIEEMSGKTWRILKRDLCGNHVTDSA